MSAGDCWISSCKKIFRGHLAVIMTSNQQSTRSLGIITKVTKFLVFRIFIFWYISGPLTSSKMFSPFHQELQWHCWKELIDWEHCSYLDSYWFQRSIPTLPSILRYAIKYDLYASITYFMTALYCKGQY